MAVFTGVCSQARSCILVAFVTFWIPILMLEQAQIRIREGAGED